MQGSQWGDETEEESDADAGGEEVECVLARSSPRVWIVLGCYVIYLHPCLHIGLQMTSWTVNSCPGDVSHPMRESGTKEIWTDIRQWSSSEVHCISSTHLVPPKKLMKTREFGNLFFISVTGLYIGGS